MPSSHSVQVSITDSYNNTTGVTTLQDATAYDVSGNHKRTDYQYILIEVTLPSGVIERLASHDFLSGEPYTLISSPSTYATPPQQNLIDYDGFGFVNFVVYSVPKKLSAPATSGEKEYGVDDVFAVDEDNIYKVVAAGGVDVTVDTDFTDTSKYEKLSTIKDVPSRYTYSESDLTVNAGTTYDDCRLNILEIGKNNVECGELTECFLMSFHFMMNDYVISIADVIDEQTDIEYTLYISNSLCSNCGCGSKVNKFIEAYTATNDSCCKTSVDELSYVSGFFHYKIPTVFDDTWISKREVYFPEFVGLSLYDIIVSISGQQLLFLEEDEDANAIEELTESGHLILKEGYQLFKKGRQITVHYKIFLQ